MGIVENFPMANFFLAWPTNFAGPSAHFLHFVCCIFCLCLVLRGWLWYTRVACGGYSSRA